MRIRAKKGDEFTLVSLSVKAYYTYVKANARFPVS